MSVCLFVMIVLGSFLSLTSLSEASSLKPFRIGTGGSTGVYYPIGKIIAASLTLASQTHSPALSGIIGVAQNSAGSIENVRGVISGELEAGLVQADIAAYASTGERDFKNLPGAADIRAIASLYSEKFQLVVRKDAGIRTFEDLKGKHISVDEPGSGTRTIMDIVLEAYGLRENDLLPLYLKPAFTEDKMKNGQLQGFALMAGAPNAAVTKLLDTGVTLLSIAPEIASSIGRQFQYLAPGKIAEGVYPGIPEINTVEVYALLVVNKEMPDDMAYELTSTLFSKETGQMLGAGHPLGKEITLSSALNGVSIPFHSGAIQYYRAHKVKE